MKKLGKISINPEKVIKNEELVNLRGGYGDPCTCTCVSSDYSECHYVFSDDGDCAATCRDYYQDEDASGICGNHYDLCSIELP